MTDNKKQKLIDEMQNLLDKIEPGQEDFINRRISHIPFAKIVIWLSYQSKKSDFVYASELAKFMKVTHTRSYSILRDLCRAGLMFKDNVTSSLIEFHFVKNSHDPIINKYVDKAMRTLNLDGS